MYENGDGSSDKDMAAEQPPKQTWWEYIMKNKVAILLIVLIIVAVLVYWFYYRKSGDGATGSTGDADVGSSASKITVTRMRGSMMY
jgi:hypothetical protein